MFAEVFPMFRSRKTVLFALVASIVASLPVSAMATDQVTTGFSPDQIVFPVVGDVTFTDDFGAPRVGHTHEGNDLISVGGIKMRPIVAAADGVVDWIDGDCCHMSIDHGDGWKTVYIHLNNDTPGTDDGLGWGIADGIEVGSQVVQGQLIGYLGDSGNAENATPHLHFEIRRDGVAIDPYSYLLAAPHLAEAGLAYSGHFRDDEGSVHEANIDKMFDLGITKGCNPPVNDRFCPYDAMTRGQVAAFLRRNLSLPAASDDYYGDDADSIFQEDINAVTAAGIGFGCAAASYCPNVALTRAELAEFLVRAYSYENPSATDYFTDDDGNGYEAAINALAASGITMGCNPPDNDRYCPESSLTRAEMATFFARILAG
jgi:hypothetical protein